MVLPADRRLHMLYSFYICHNRGHPLQPNKLYSDIFTTGTFFIISIGGHNHEQKRHFRIKKKINKRRMYHYTDVRLLCEF